MVMEKRTPMNFRSDLLNPIALTLTCFPFIAAQAQPTLSPEDHCRNFPADAVVTFADPDLAGLVHDAVGLDAQEPLSCERAADLEQFAVTATSERVVYGGTLRPARAPSESAFESLNGIQNLTGLTSLSMFDRLITDIDPLRHLTKLTSLVLHTNWINDIEPLSGLVNLERLIISENPISDIGPLAGLTKLRQLHVHGLYPNQLNYWLAMDDGRDPDVVFNGITDISPLAGLTEMRLLRIHLNSIEDITPLANLTNLIHLRMYDNQIKDISSLAGLNELVLLWAHGNQIEDIRALSGMSEMQQLSLDDNVISDVSALAGMTRMKELFLTNNSIEDIAPLRRLRALEVLRLENNKISDVSAIGGLDQLRELSLAQNWSLSDVQPLLQNMGIATGDELDLRFTAARCSDIDAFANRGVTLLRATTVNGSGCAGRRLEDP
jgi:hypothetical protein